MPNTAIPALKLLRLADVTMRAGRFGGSLLRAGVMILFIVTSAVRADADGA
jgi:hypothetical protein